MQQRWISILAIALGLQVVLAVSLGLRGDRLAPASDSATLISADLKDVDKLVFDGPQGADVPAPKASDSAASAPDADTHHLELVKHDGKWVLPQLQDAPADAAKVQGLLDKLAHLKRGLPVARTKEAQQRFKVADSDYERRVVLSHGDKPVATAFLGTAPAMRKAHARSAQDDAVYAVDLTPQDAETAPKEWLDTGLLQLNTAAISQITVAARGKDPLTLEKAAAPAPAAAASGASAVAVAASGAASAAGADVWQAKAGSTDTRADSGRVTALVNAMANLRVDGVLGTQAKPEWQQDTPELNLSFKNAQGQPVTWVLSKPRTGEDYVLKASDRPWFLELKRWAAQPVLDAAAPDKLLAGTAAASSAAASAPAAAASAAPAHAGTAAPHATAARTGTARK